MLEGLRTRLHRMHAKWEMIFVDSGERAINELENGQYDVIVTDMRMPGMDGAQLLQTVSARWPKYDAHRAVGLRRASADHPPRTDRTPVPQQAVRISDASRTSSSVLCSCTSCFATLELRASVGRIRKLPAMPRTYAKLQEALASDSCTVQEIAKIVAADTAIAARVLQIVNSAFFRLARRITNVEQAVTYLGFAAVRNLVMSAEVFAEWQAARCMREPRAPSKPRVACRQCYSGTDGKNASRRRCPARGPCSRHRLLGSGAGMPGRVCAKPFRLRARKG